MHQYRGMLSDRMRRAREDRDLTQADLARAVGVDIRTVQGWEAEGRTPRGKAARNVEEVLGIDLSAHTALPHRIRAAREDRGMSQQALADELGVHLNTVQGWESGRHPRGKPARNLERFLSIDLDARPESSSPRLDEATDAQLIAHLAGRLHALDKTVTELRQQLTER